MSALETIKAAYAAFGRNDPSVLLAQPYGAVRRPCATLATMFPAFALAIALNVSQPAAPPPVRPASPPVSEATPVAVPPATPKALRYYASGNRLWLLDQVLSIVLLAIILFSGFSVKLRTWAQRIGRN